MIGVATKLGTPIILVTVVAPAAARKSALAERQNRRLRGQKRVSFDGAYRLTRRALRVLNRHRVERASRGCPLRLLAPVELAGFALGSASLEKALHAIPHVAASISGWLKGPSVVTPGQEATCTHTLIANFYRRWFDTYIRIIVYWSRHHAERPNCCPVSARRRADFRG